MTDMLFFPLKDMPSFTEGEALFFTREPAMANTLSVLCGVSGRAAPDTVPRLLICDGGDPLMCTEAPRTSPDTPILFYTPTPALFVPPQTASQYRILGRPFLFDELGRAAAELLKTAPAVPPAAGKPPLHIRMEGCTAVSDGIRVQLTPCEAALLRALADAYPEPASRESLTQVFSRKSSNTVSVYTTYLRRKLAVFPAFQGILSLRDGSFALVLRGNPKDNENR